MFFAVTYTRTSQVPELPITPSATYSSSIAATHSSAPVHISPNASSPNETTIQKSNITIIIVATVIGVLIVGLLIAFVLVLRRRRNKQVDPEPPPHHIEHVILDSREWEFSRNKLRFLEELGKMSLVSVFGAR